MRSTSNTLQATRLSQTRCTSDSNDRSNCRDALRGCGVVRAVHALVYEYRWSLATLTALLDDAGHTMTRGYYAAAPCDIDAVVTTCRNIDAVATTCRNIDAVVVATLVSPCALLLRRSQFGAHMRRLFARVRTPMLAVSATDDRWSPPPSRNAFLLGYENAKVTTLDLHPTQSGVGALGHMGSFCLPAAALWPRVFDWFASVSAHGT